MNANRRLTTAQVANQKPKASSVSSPESCRKSQEQVRTLKESLLSQYGAALNGKEQILRSAITEAEALAWQTTYPHLVFPVLAEEKLIGARRWVWRQESVRRAAWSRVLVA
jgi:hypothetical protein